MADFVISSDIDARKVKEGSKEIIQAAEEQTAAWQHSNAALDAYQEKLDRTAALQQKTTSATPATGGVPAQSSAQIPSNAADVVTEINRIPSAAEAAYSKMNDAATRSASVRSEIEKNYTNLSSDEQKRLTGETLKELDNREKASAASTKRSAAENAAEQKRQAKDAASASAAEQRESAQRAARQVAAANADAARDSALSFDTIFGASFFAGLAVDAAKAFTTGLVSKLSDATQYAARTEELGVALNGLAKASDLSVDSIHRQEKALEDANIATQTARQVLTQYIAAGLPLEKSGPLAAVAKDLGVIAGQSSSEELQNLIQGITTLQVRVLRTAGVYISLNQEYNKYLETEAKASGQNKRTVQDMSTQEKQQVALNAVLQFGTRATGLYETAMNTAAKQQRSLQRVSDDFSNAIGTKMIPVLYATNSVYGTFLKIAANSPTAFLVAAAAVGVLTIALIAMNTAQIKSLPVIGQAISSVQLLGQVMMRNASLTAGATATTALFTAGWAAVAALAIAAGYAIYSYNTAVDHSKDITKESIDAITSQKTAYVDQAEKMRNLSTSNLDLSEKQQLITDGYRAMSLEAQKRFKDADTETEKIKILADEYERLAKAQDPKLATDSRLLTSDYETKLKELSDLDAKQKQMSATADNAQAALNKYSSSSMSDGIDPAEIAGAIEMKKAADKAFSDLNSKMYGGSDGTLGAVNEAKDLIEKIQAIAKARHMDVDAMIQEKYAYEGHADQAAQAIANLHGMENQFHITATASDEAKNSLDEQTNSVYNLRKELSKLTAPNQEIIDKAVYSFVTHTKTVAEAKAAAQQALSLPDSPLAKMIAENKGVEDRTKGITDLWEPKEKKERTHKTKTEAESLTGSLQKLNGEVESFTNLSSKSFELRFKKEELERVKQDFEKIISLRRDLGLPIAAALPVGEAAANQELDHLERVKKLRDEVLKVVNETVDAEDKLLVSRITASIPVIDAQLRADQAYFDSVRSRANAEQQLTADIVGEIRKRETAQTDSARNSFQIQAQAYKDLIAEQNTRTEDRSKQLVKLALQLNTSFDNNPLIKAANRIAGAGTPDSPVLGKLDTSNDLLSQILDAVRVKGSDGANAEEFTGGGGSGKRWDYKSIESFINNQGFHVSKGGGYRPDGKGHNKNSLHYLGLADDVSIAGRSTADIEELMRNAILAGIRVVDERTKPKSSKEWSAPHIHLEENDKRASYLPRNADLAELDRQRRAGTLKSGQVARTAQVTPAAATDLADDMIGGASLLADTSNGSTAASDYAGAYFQQKQLEKELNAKAQPFFAGGDVAQKDSRASNFISDDAYKALVDYTSQLDRFTIKEGETVSAGEREAAGMSKLARYRNVQVDQIKDLAALNEKLAAIQSGDDVAKTEVLQADEIQRKQNLASVLSENIVLTEKLRNDNRDAAAEAAQFNNERLQALGAVGTAEANLEKSRTLNSDRDVQRAKQETAVITERTDLENRLAAIENERATSGVNQALRVRVGIEEELLAIHKADYNAQVNAAKAEVELADRENVHLEQVRAGVLQHLAEAKTATQTWIDEINSIYDQAGALTDKLVDKSMIGKIPIIGGLAKNALRNGLTEITHNLVNAFLPDLNLDKQPDAPTGNVVADRVGESNRYLKNIDKHISGGSSTGSSIVNNIIGIGESPEGAKNGPAQGTGGFSVGGFLSGALSGIGKFFGIGGSLTPGSSSSMGGGVVPIIGTDNPASRADGTAAGTGIVAANSSRLINAITQQVSSVVDTIHTSVKTDTQIEAPTPITESGGGHDVVETAGHTAGDILGKGGKFSFADLKGSLAKMAPALGASLGGSLGGSSLTGSLLGSGGGLLAGTLLSGLLTTGSISGAGSAGILGSIGGALGLSGAATFGITAAIGGVLLLGSYLLGKGAQRKKDEVTRTNVINDALGQVQELTKEVNNDKITDGQSALAQANAIRAQYVSQVGQLTDKKTRNIALQDVYRIDNQIVTLQQAVSSQEGRQDTASKFKGEFATGGIIYADGGIAHPAFAAQLGYKEVLPRGFSGKIPGSFDHADDIRMNVSRGEHVLVLNPTQYSVIGDRLRPLLQEANVPQHEGGAVYTPSAPVIRSSSNNSSNDESDSGSDSSKDKTPIVLEVHIDGMGEMVDARIRTNKNINFYIATIKTWIKDKMRVSS